MGLVGNEWPKFEPPYRELRARLENSTGPAQMLVATEVVDLFAPHAAAHQHLMEAIAQQTEVGALLLGLADIAEQLNLAPPVSAHFKEAAQPGAQAQRFIWQSSPTKATSLKLGNLSFEFGAFSELITGVIATTSKGVLGEADVILKAAGVLLIISSLYKATAVKLDEREATVFCGFAKAPRKSDGGVKEEVILAHTNAVRHTVSLMPLDMEKLGNALYKLAEIKSVERVAGHAGTWRIIENHNVKNWERARFLTTWAHYFRSYHTLRAVCRICPAAWKAAARRWPW
jgi:hypothetical protein